MAIETTSNCTVVTTPHGQVLVRDTGGTGTPVLLVHSLLVDGDLYARLWPLLAARGYRCLIPELPFGAHQLAMSADADLTPPGLAALLVHVLDALDVPRVNVVGVDTGGALTQLLMAGHRDRVGAAVLTACDAYDAFPPRSFAPIVALLKIPGSTWLTAQLARLRIVRRLGNLSAVTHAGVDDATLQRWTRPLRTREVRRDLRKVLRDMKPEHTIAAAAKNADFPRPVLIAWGDDARLFPRRLAEQLHADIPGSRLVTIPDCAAFAALDQPALLAELIDGHLTASAHSTR
jgi:pimeloyl-ACP methyl ester carboxylesterase